MSWSLDYREWPSVFPNIRVFSAYLTSDSDNPERVQKTHTHTPTYTYVGLYVSVCMRERERERESLKQRYLKLYLANGLFFLVKII